MDSGNRQCGNADAHRLDLRFPVECVLHLPPDVAEQAADLKDRYGCIGKASAENGNPDRTDEGIHTLFDAFHGNGDTGRKRSDEFSVIGNFDLIGAVRADTVRLAETLIVYLNVAEAPHGLGNGFGMDKSNAHRVSEQFFAVLLEDDLSNTRLYTESDLLVVKNNSGVLVRHGNLHSLVKNKRFCVPNHDTAVAHIGCKYGLSHFFVPLLLSIISHN